MREIKFRAWDKTNKKMWQTGEEGNELNGYTFQTYFDKKGLQAIIYGERYQVTDDPFPMYDCDQRELPLMQFTGLHDKKDKEIYSGDIIQQFDDRCVVRDCPGGWQLGMIQGGNSGSTFVVSFLGEYCEVIGNIYENHELIGK